MSEIIYQLATIEVSNDMLRQLDIAGIYHQFNENYQRLGDLKKFTSDFEKKNRLMRWWHSDKLQAAHIDSSEVQAEFSKTIGQLMMISIMQSKELNAQQKQLNASQGELQIQAAGIAEHAGQLQQQHDTLAKQSVSLRELVDEYFALKGLTADGAQKLIDIAADIKATKQNLQQEFADRTLGFEMLCEELTAENQALSAQVQEQLGQNQAQTQAALLALQQQTGELLLANQSALRSELGAAQQAMQQTQHDALARQTEQNISVDASLSTLAAGLEKQQTTQEIRLASIHAELAEHVSRATTVREDLTATKTNLAAAMLQQQALLDAQQLAKSNIQHLRYLSTGLSVLVLGLLAAVARVAAWI